jgi:UPF0271 protein
VACGFHAGDPRIIDRTVGLAARHHVAVGAHPSHHDLRGFGRREVKASPEEVEADVVYQVGAVLAFARAHGVPLVHVKPHGALYNQAVDDEPLARAIARGVRRVSPELIFVGLATSKAMREAAKGEGLRYAGEAFADRVYNPDGTLQSRRIPARSITDRKARSRRSRSRPTAGDRTTDRVRLDAETLCLHWGQQGGARERAAVRRALEEGLEIKGLSA